MELSQFIDKLRQEGSVDSEGQFTLGFADARRKLSEFAVVKPDRYLVLLVSAAIAQGATDIHVDRDDFELHFKAESVYFSTQQIRRGFESLLAGKGGSAALDLALGLHGAFQVDALTVEVDCWHPEEPSFSWTMKADQEDVKPLVSCEKHELRMVICFQKRNVLTRTKSWLRQAGGHSVVGPESALVARYCSLSLVDIFLNQELVVTGVRAREAPVGAMVTPFSPLSRDDRETFRIRGNPHEATGQLLDRTATNWLGWVSLQEGPLHFVIHGVTYTADESLGLAGVVYCSELERDLSREKVVKNQTYRALLEELDELRVEMVRNLRVYQVKVEWKAWVAEQARDCAQRDLLGPSLLVSYADWLRDDPKWLKARAVIQLARTRRAPIKDEPRRVEELMEQALRDARDYLEEFKDDLVVLDLCCQILERLGEVQLWDWYLLAGLAALQDGSPGARDRFQLSIANLDRLEELGSPGSSLRRPIAFLGLGLAAWREGEPEAAQGAWSEAKSLAAKNPLFSVQSFVDGWTSDPPSLGVEELVGRFWDLAADPESLTQVCRPALRS